MTMETPGSLRNVSLLSVPSEKYDGKSGKCRLRKSGQSRDLQYTNYGGETADYGSWEQADLQSWYLSMERGLSGWRT